MSVCFGEFRFNRGARILLRHGHVVPLLARPLELLGILLDRRSKPVTRLELERLLWPDGHVPENGLSKSVLDVRRALGDQDRCALIRTVHGFGYAFIGRAREETQSPPPPKLGSFRALINGREIALVQGENVSIQILCADKPTDRVPVARDSAKARRTAIRETELTLVRGRKRADG